MNLIAFFRNRVFRPKKTLCHDIRLAIYHVLDLANLYRIHGNNEVAYYNLLFSIALPAAPLIIVELGTGPGVSSLAFRRVIEYYNGLRSQQGILHTCDLDEKTLQKVRRWGKNVQAHLMSTNEFAREWARHQTPIDILYIDADHSHEQSQKDFDNFASFIRPNGLVLMHDTFPLSEAYEQPHLSGTVYKTAQYIKCARRDEFEIMTLPYLCGISLLRKKGAKYF